ncbi:arsenate reductase family protein [Mangrovicoccus algicola]|uniref:Arsenate reductase n=1 Tax=Mangrovicoccus algicola TaxID=2771008 RepID=A0A8J7CM09_9RHOB|nr:ArsC/Spx/MgsR family protein [Mangrovicoccus algicola]MBE3640081.1 arsenate reductase [Mangrovicoccus algicola]
MIVYGLKTCDTCRKARRALAAAGQEPAFVDLRETPVTAEKIGFWLERLGPGLMNTRSTTWRGLSETERAGDPVALMTAHPALIKRPVIEDGAALHLGWGRDVQAALLPE